MKRIAISVLTLAVAAAGIAAAQGYRDDPRNRQMVRSDIAQVVNVERVGSAYPSGYERQECWNDSMRGYEGGYYRDREGRLYHGDANNASTRGAVIGAIVGGALGNQVGKGDGRTAATVAGAAIGASIGANANNGNNGPEYQFRDNRGTVRRCRTVFVPTGPQGPAAWAVTYRYGGQQYREYTNNRPGRTVHVRVQVQMNEQ